MADPFAARKQSVPVTVVTDAARLQALAVDGTAIVRLEAPAHGHDAGVACVVCETRGDVRVALFELLERNRLGAVPDFERVVVDASAATNAGEIIEALIPGSRPALGLRDFTVARSFHLDPVQAATQAPAT